MVLESSEIRLENLTSYIDPDNDYTVNKYNPKFRTFHIFVNGLKSLNGVPMMALAKRGKYYIGEYTLKSIHMLNDSFVFRYELELKSENNLEEK